tara:strand:- start:1050 stop:2411 length:1362 start_codon:yes stop_codon:yes gene_type:complete
MIKKEVSFRHINKIAIPALLASIAEPLLSSTDAAVVGNLDLNATESLAAVGIVGAFLSMLIWILGQTRSAISAIISQHVGANKLEEVSNLPAQAIFFNLLLSLLVLGGTALFIEPIFELLNAKDQVLEYCIQYYEIRVWGFPLTLFTFAIFGIFRGLQNTTWPMVIAITGAIVNIGLDFVFVYGVDGFIPSMHIKGAAWASLIAQLIMAIMAFGLLKSKTSISLRLNFPIHPDIKQLAIMSLNLFIRTLALNVAFILAVRVATDLGKEIIAAHTIAINLWLFSAFFLDGYASAGNILGGKLYGARDFDSLKILAKRCLNYGLMMACLLLVIGIITYSDLGRVFSNQDEVLTIFSSFFFIVLISLPINAVAFIYDGIFKGLGKMGFLRNVLLISTFIGFAPTLYISLYFDLGIYGIWLAFLVWMLVRAIALVWKLNRFIKEEKTKYESVELSQM